MLRTRRSLRLRGFDYAQPMAYFITICAYRRAHMFGHLISQDVVHSDLGRIITEYWSTIPSRFPFVELDAFVVMPNHLHGIIRIVPHRTETMPGWHSPQFRSSPGSVGTIMRAFKGRVTRWATCHTELRRVWHRNYYEHVVRDQRDLARIRRYIAANPARAPSRYPRPSKPRPRDSASMTP